jgi:glycosyltransferase involved in cell wall biosynthesis
MKILQVTSVDFALRKFLLPLVDALETEGHTVHIACNSGDNSIGLISYRYKLHHTAFSRNLNVISHLGNLMKLVKLIKKEQYDCIHTHTPVASIIARLAGRIARVPVIIYTAHGFYFHENMNPIVYKLIYYLEKVWGKYFTDYLFFQSAEDYRLAVEHEFNKNDRLLHIGNGVSADLFNPLIYDREQIRKQFRFKENDLVLIFVGRLVKEKGISELLKAYEVLKQQYPRIHLMIVGGSVEGDRDSFDIKSHISEMEDEVKKDIHCLGLRSDIPTLLSAADIFILPSHREGLPRSIIEAMAMGKPIIATDIRGCREEVFPEYNGYLFKVKDSKELEKKIKLMLDKIEKISEFGLNSRELFLNQFDERIVLEKQLKVFRQISEDVG